MSFSFLRERADIAKKRRIASQWMDMRKFTDTLIRVLQCVSEKERDRERKVEGKLFTTFIF